MFEAFSTDIIVISACVALLAGLVKGAVGFAMPMIMMSGISSVAAPDIALAALILPTVATNFVQAFRQGPRAVIATLREFWIFVVLLLLMLVLSAQLVTGVSPKTFYLAVGAFVVFFTTIQLIGFKLHLPAERRRQGEAAAGTIAGFVGGISGIWGPPTVLYLTAINTAKSAQMRIQGVFYGVGSIALFFSHIQSGILNSATLQFSSAMLLPALLGVWIGFRLHDRLDQTRFRRVTLIVLIIAGANLLRKGFMA